MDILDDMGWVNYQQMSFLKMNFSFKLTMCFAHQHWFHEWKPVSMWMDDNRIHPALELCFCVRLWPAHWLDKFNIQSAENGMAGQHLVG